MSGGEPRPNRRVRPRPSDEDTTPDGERPPGLFGRLRARLGHTLAPMRRGAELTLRALVVFAVAAGAVALGRLIERHVRTAEAFAVTTLEVSGHVRLTQAEVTRTAGLALGRNVFDTSPEEARARLEAHPWVAHAAVERRLPGTYRVALEEHRAVAVLSVGELYLVGEDGALFKAVEPGDPVDLPVITGVERARFARDRGYRTSVLLEVVALLSDYQGARLSGPHPVQEIHAEPDDGLTLYAGEDPTYVRLGRGPFRTKLDRLRQVWDELAARGAEAEYVYLDNERRPDRVTVRARM